MDQASRRIIGSLAVPPNLPLILLAPHSPEPNPVERVWLLLGKQDLSHRLTESYNAIVNALCIA